MTDREYLLEKLADLVELGHSVSPGFICEVVEEAIAALSPQTLPAPGEVDDGKGLICEHDDGEYTIIWPTNEWLVAHADGKITVGISPRAETQPRQITIADLRLATVAAANDEGVAEAFSRGIEAAAKVAAGSLRVVRRPKEHETADCAWNEAVLSIAAAIRLLSQGGGK